MKTTKRIRMIGLLILLSLLIGAAIIVYHGKSRPSPVGLQAVVEMAFDVQRDLEQVGKHVTRVSDDEEMRLGQEISGRAASWWHMGPKAQVAYVSDIGNELARHVRRPGIKYTFHVIDSDMVNAFALPGGQIFIMRGLLQFVQTEAELAAVIGHEISHVDLRHCIEMFQYQLAIDKAAGVAGQVFGGDMTKFVIQATAQIGLIVHRILTMGYQKELEFDADEQGWTLAVAAGYDPEAAIAFMGRLDDQFGRSRPAPPQPKNPASEIASAIKTAAGSYFHSHPPAIERIRHLKQLKEKYSQALTGKRFYIGRRNLSTMTAHSRKEYTEKDEFRQY